MKENAVLFQFDIPLYSWAMIIAITVQNIIEQIAAIQMQL